MEKPSSVAEYLSALSEDERAALEGLRETIRAAAPMATAKISYGMPTSHHRGNLVHHAAFKEHCSVGVLAEIPATLVRGRSDFQSPLASAWQLNRAFERAELVVVDDAGHDPHARGITDELIRATDRSAPAH